jgi:glycosyltransferase involved in cell wall biosynthesis
VAVICLITPGQPSTNPRLVKEADALVEAGHRVHVICAHWAEWADNTDRALLDSRTFTCTYVGGDAKRQPLAHVWTRVRHRCGRELLRCRTTPTVRNWALCRVTPDLQRAAEKVDADLYIAHNLGALPAAWNAARRRGAKLGFDAEDFHSGMRSKEAGRSVEAHVIDETERALLPQCDYVTAASPLIARSYARKYSISTPRTILNVFPLRDRPSSFRPSNEHEPLRLCWFSQTIGSGRGLEDIVRAAGMLPDQHIELHLLGHWSAGYQETLHTLASSAGFPSTRIHAHAPIGADAVISWAANYDVGIAAEHPNTTNADICLSNKLFAYLLAGNALLATATNSQKKFMEANPGASLSYRPGDASDLAAKLRVWCEDRRGLGAARRRAWDYGTARFNWDLERSTFLNVIQTVLARGTRRIASGARAPNVRVNDPAH